MGMDEDVEVKADPPPGGPGAGAAGTAGGAGDVLGGLSPAEFNLERRLSATANVSKALAGMQSLQLLAVFDCVMTARLTPEVYLLPDDRLRHEKAIEYAKRSVVLDLTMRLAPSENTIWSLFHDAETLILRLPRVWDALHRGELCCANARTAADTARSLPHDDEAALAALDAALAEKGPRLTPAKFRAAARAARDGLHPVDPVERHEEAFQKRRVTFTPDLDGMGWLEAYLDAPTLVKAQTRIEAHAKRLKDSGDPRTLTQLRADITADLLTGRGTPGEVKVRAIITVPVTALAECPKTLEDARLDPAILEGHGPIDEVTAGRLVEGAASFRRLFTDPIRGIELTLDRTSYRPTAGQREWLRRRYGTCIAPTCSRATPFSDIENTTAWADLRCTDIDNLAPLSRGHHTLKHATKFTVTRRPDGIIRWTTPTGYACDNDPPPFQGRTAMRP